MAENLAYLPEVSPSNKGSNSEKHYYVYGYVGSSASAAKQKANYGTYGVLYNWPAAMNGSSSGGIVQGICPNGWHLPSDAEWTTLTNFLGSSAGDKMKEEGTNHWSYPNTRATNESGFSARPGGDRGPNGGFDYLGFSAFFWSFTEDGSSDAWYRYLGYYGGDGVYRYSGVRSYGFSVRCIKDE